VRDTDKYKEFKKDSRVWERRLTISYRDHSKINFDISRKSAEQSSMSYYIVKLEFSVF
jgi:hypothetical protein